MACELYEILVHGAKFADMLELKKQLINLAERAKRVVGIIGDGFKCILEVLVNLPTVDRRVKEQVNEFKSAVATARANGLALLDKVYRFYKYSNLDNDEAQYIKQLYQEKNTERIKTYLKQMRKYLESCEQAYTNFMEAYAHAKSLCLKITEACEIKRGAAKTDKEKSQMISMGAAAATVVGAGAVGTGILCIALMPITGGVSAIVGLSVAGIAATTVGSATAAIGSVTTITSLANAIKKEHLEGCFRDLCDNMDAAIDHIRIVNSSLLFIHEKLEINEENIDTALDHVDNPFGDFCKVFDILQDGVRQGNEELSRHSLAIVS